MNPTLKTDEKGLVKTGDYTSVNPLYATQESLNQAYKIQGVSGPITSVSLQGAQPLSIPQVRTSTTADGIIGLSQGILDTTKASRLAEETALKEQQALAAKEESKTGLRSIMERITGVQASRGSLETEQKIGEKSQKVTDVTNQIESVQRALQNELKAVDQVGTLTDVQKAARKNEINRQYSSQLADLSIIQSAANRDLATAQNIIDRKIEVQLDPLKTQLEFTKMFYEDNKADFTKAEERAFNLKTKELERSYEEAKSLQETIGKLQLSAASQGADPSIVQAIGRARTQDEAIQAAGQYAGDILDRQIKQAQLAKLLEEAKTTSTGGKLTAAQQTALSYAQRVNDANRIIDEVGGQFTGAGSYFGQYAPNVLKSSDRQRFEQAKRNFINAVLRRESGAAIAESEFESAKKQYFPQPGDSIAVMEQKRINRERTLENLLREGGQNLSIVNQSKDPLGIGVQANPLGI